MRAIIKHPHPLTGRGVAYRLGSGPSIPSLLDSAFHYAWFPNLKIISVMLKWFEWETAPGVFDTDLEDQLRAAFEDAAANGYEILLRFTGGCDVPSWLFDDPYRVVNFTLYNNEGEQPELVKVPRPDDETLLERYNLVLDRLASLLREQIGTTGKFAWQLCTLVPAAMPTSIGSEMSIGYSVACGDAHATTAVSNADFDVDDRTISMSTSPAGWPSEPEEFIVRWGTSTNESGDRLTYPIVNISDRFSSFEGRDTATNGWGYNQNNQPYSAAVVQAGGETGSLADLGTLDGFGFCQMPAKVSTAGYRMVWHPSYPVTDVELWHRFISSTAGPYDQPLTGDSDYLIMVRGTDENNCYLVGVRLGVSQTDLIAVRRVAGVDTVVGSTAITTDISPDVSWMLRVRVETVAGDVEISAKAMQWLTPAGWELTVTDSSASKILGPGATGVAWRQNAGNPVRWITEELRGSVPLAGPTLHKVTRNGSTLTLVDYTGWSGSFGVSRASGSTLRYVNDPDLDTEDLDTEVGPFNPFIRNLAWAEQVIQGEVVRRDIYRDAWAKCVHEHMARLPHDVRTGLAGSALWSDNFIRADQLAGWGGARSNDLPAIAETGAAAFDGTVPRGNYGRRLLAMTTNIDHLDDWASAENEPDFYVKAAAAGCEIAAQTAGTGRTSSGQNIVTAIENFLDTYPDALFVETGSTRFDDGIMTFEFGGALANQNLTQMTVTPTGLTNGTVTVDTLVEGSGSQSEIQTISLGIASAGTVTITFQGQTTAAIAYNATATQVKNALVALSNVGPNDVVVTGNWPAAQTTGNYLGWTGGAGKTMAEYLIDDPVSVQERIVA